jgi:hypothetical protein
MSASTKGRTAKQSNCSVSQPVRGFHMVPTLAINQSTLTFTSLALASSVLGSLTFKIPFLKVALTLSA